MLFGSSNVGMHIELVRIRPDSQLPNFWSYSFFKESAADQPLVYTGGIVKFLSAQNTVFMKTKSS